MAIGNEEKFAGMTRAEVLEVAKELNQELDENEEESKDYSEYIKAMEAGQEELKKLPSYYPYLSKGANN